MDNLGVGSIGPWLLAFACSGGGGMTPERLEELKRLCERATKAPWSSSEEMVHMADYSFVAHLKTRIIAECSRKVDAWFIGEAREALPALIAEVERLHRLEKTLIASGPWTIEKAIISGGPWTEKKSEDPK